MLTPLETNNTHFQNKTNMFSNNVSSFVIESSVWFYINLQEKIICFFVRKCSPHKKGPKCLCMKHFFWGVGSEGKKGDVRCLECWSNLVLLGCFKIIFNEFRTK